MRIELLGVLGLVGCAAAVSGPVASPPPPPAPPPVAARAAAPPTADPLPTKPAAITDQARAHARTAFAQALELWSQGRKTEAKSMVEVGLAAIGRHTPEDCKVSPLMTLADSAVFSDDESLFAIGDAETLLVADSATGRFLGLRAHDFASGLRTAVLSPKGTVVVAPSGTELSVYESRGLTSRLRVPSRTDAPFAFVSEDQIVTVRLGDATRA